MLQGAREEAYAGGEAKDCRLRTRRAGRQASTPPSCKRQAVIEALIAWYKNNDTGTGEIQGSIILLHMREPGSMPRTTRPWT